VQQLRDSLELLPMPPDMMDRLNAAATREAEEAALPVMVVVLDRERMLLDRAMEHAKSRIGGNPRRGTCLARIAMLYLEAEGEMIEEPAVPA
jgi:hypothetical protein